MVKTTNHFIYKELQQQLERFKDVSHPKQLICFSGVSGSGKTAIATELEHRLRAVRISNDEIRSVLENNGVIERDAREMAKETFLKWLLERVTLWPNGYIILDSGIDRRFEEVYEKFSDRGYGFFVISLNAPRDVLEERIANRKGHRAKPDLMLASIDQWINDKSSFDESHSSHVDITIDTTKPVDIDMVITRFEEKVNSKK